MFEKLDSNFSNIYLAIHHSDFVEQTSLEWYNLSYKPVSL